MKLKEFKEFLNNPEFKGLEDCKVLISSDEEGNQYHSISNGVGLGETMVKTRMGWEAPDEEKDPKAVRCVIFYPDYN